MLSLNKISANAALFMLASAMQVAANSDAHEPGDSTPTDLYDDYDCKASNGCGSSSGDEWYFVVFAYYSDVENLMNNGMNLYNLSKPNFFIIVNVTIGIPEAGPSPCGSPSASSSSS